MPGSVSIVNRPKRTSVLASKNLKSLLWPAIFMSLVIVIDQATKFWAVGALTDQPSIRVLGDFLMFTLVYNYGGALGTSFGPSQYYLVSSSLILLFVLYYLYQNRHHRVTSIPLALIAGGAIGNILDRLRLGRVVDFIDVDMPDVSLFGYEINRWWTFNIADAAISCSIVFLLVHVLFFHKSETVTATESGTSETDQTDDKSDSDSSFDRRSQSL